MYGAHVLLNWQRNCDEWRKTPGFSRGEYQMSRRGYMDKKDKLEIAKTIVGMINSKGCTRRDWDSILYYIKEMLYSQPISSECITDSWFH
nr:MAG TPA: hypothetical protein [Caudoviricetes sp.]